MSEVVIKAENLGKKYTIGHLSADSNPGYTALRDVITQNIRGLLDKSKDLIQGKPIIQGDTQEDVWALHDLNFEIKQGEAVGIIGRNGAGKSTLLKILSRITEPSAGRVTIHGRVASLLEVGTGFHPELTGRENIYLNGAILGMTRKEIRRKFDEIVAFAEIDKYLDTPVKRYSSGMYVRLAFAVAAHLEPEILVVDEVLAVGDAAFQKKSLGKMNDVAHEGRTVLFVSHNMAAIQQLCQSGILLHNGQITYAGAAQETLSRYLQDTRANQAMEVADRHDRKGSQWLTFTKVEMRDASGTLQGQVLSGQDVYFRLYYKSDRRLQNADVSVSFNVRSNQGYLLTNLNSVDVNQQTMDIYETGYFQCLWPKFNLRSGSYEGNLFCQINGEIVDWLQSAFTIDVEDGDFYGTGRLVTRSQGDLLVPQQWSSVPDNQAGYNAVNDIMQIRPEQL